MGSLGVVYFFSSCGLYALITECTLSNYDLNLLSVERVIFLVVLLSIVSLSFTAKLFRLEVY